MRYSNTRNLVDLKISQGLRIDQQVFMVPLCGIFDTQRHYLLCIGKDFFRQVECHVCPNV